MIIRCATADDAAALASVERESWPDGLAGSESDCRARINTFSNGQLLIEENGRIIAVCSAQRISRQQLFQAQTYDAITDSGRFAATHDANGDVYQLVGVAVARRFQGLNLGRRLVDEQITRARSMDGIKRIVGFTRPVAFHKFPDRDIESYVATHNGSGIPVDPVLAFHLTAGAKIVSLHANFRPKDAQARGYGILIEYPLRAEG